MRIQSKFGGSVILLIGVLVGHPAPVNGSSRVSATIGESPVRVQAAPAASADGLDEFRALLRGRDFVLVISPDGTIEVRIYEGGREVLQLAGAAVTVGRPPAAPITRITPETDREASDDPYLLRADALMNADPQRRGLALDRLVGADEEKLTAETALAVLDGEHDRLVLETALDLLDGLETLPLEPLLRWVSTPQDSALRVRAMTMLRERAEGDRRVRQLLRSLGAKDADETVRGAARTLLEDLEPGRR